MPEGPPAGPVRPDRTTTGEGVSSFAMPHWDHRTEARWKDFRFNQPYAKGLRRLREEVLAKTDFDPATLWQWGTMQAMALIQILEACEARFGEEGQKLVYDALH